MNKIKRLYSKIKKIIVALCQKGLGFYNHNFGNTEKSIYWLTIIILSVIFGLFYGDLGLPNGVGFVLATVVGFILVNLFFWVAILFINLLWKIGAKYLLYTCCLVSIISTLIISGSSGNLSDMPAIIAAVIILAIFQLFVRSVWSFFRNKVHTKTVVLTMLSTSVFSVIFCIFIIGQGFDDSYIDSYLALNVKQNNVDTTINSSGLQASLKPGSYTVESLEYGMSEDMDLQSKTFNMTPYIGGYDGIQGFYRKIYQGYDKTNVPLAGKIWYPKECNNSPVLFIAHGNHTVTEPSYLGYGYLGEYLASYGYVVVSVDENFCNGSMFGGLSEENDGRAVLLLENMKQVQNYNNDVDSPLYKKMDYNNIAIAGHSRGGEMVADAVLFNQYSYYPTNGTIRFYYHFNIKSVIAIAPSVNQYKPAGHDVKLTDVNYLLIHGANDQDVSTFMGTRQYKNIAFSGNGDYFKSYLYIAGANHGQFNTVWGRYDVMSPISQFLNVENLMEASKQQQILKTFSKVFLDTTLKGDSQYKGLFYDYEKYRSNLPETVYIQNYADSTFECISDYEEDSNLDTATAKDVVLKAYGVTRWTEEMTHYSNLSYGGERGNYALRLRWKEDTTGIYEIKLPDYDGSNKYLQFDIQDMDNKLAAKKEYSNLDCTIKLYDSDGNQAQAKLSDYCTVYPPLPVKLGKFQYILNTTEYKHQFQTVRIPMDEVCAEGKVDVANIVKIQFVFDKDGSTDVNLDNIGFGKK